MMNIINNLIMSKSFGAISLSSTDLKSISDSVDDLFVLSKEGFVGDKGESMEVDDIVAALTQDGISKDLPNSLIDFQSHQDECVNAFLSNIQLKKRKASKNREERIAKKREEAAAALLEETKKLKASKEKKSLTELAKSAKLCLSESHPVPTVEEMFGDAYYKWWLEEDAMDRGAGEEEEEEEEEEESSDDSEDDRSGKRRTRKKKGSKRNSSSAKRPAAVIWEKTLRHQGVTFPDPYEPHGVPLVYDGDQYVLPPECEEAATLYAQSMHLDHVKNKIYNNNFWADFRELLKQHDKSLAKKLKSFAKADFSLILAHEEEIRAEKKAWSKEKKQADKLRREKIKEKYGYAFVDGNKVVIAPYQVEPPCVFKARGTHPKSGKIKFRVTPEAVTLNLDKDAPIPPLPSGRHWGAIVHNPTVSWVATWCENIFGRNKYVRFGNTSHVKGRSDWFKFETARRLAGLIGYVRFFNFENMSHSSASLARQQHAVATYILDLTAIRAGGKKDTTMSADTVGLCNLRKEHIKFHANSIIELDFLGKDSVPYHRRVKVRQAVYKLLKGFVSGKSKKDELFDLISTSSLNTYLASLFPSIKLTIKVFRTFNASLLLSKRLETITEPSGSVADRKQVYQRANTEVAVICNHQRNVGKSHDASVGKMDEFISEKIDLISTLRWYELYIAMLMYSKYSFDVYDFGRETAEELLEEYEKKHGGEKKGKKKKSKTKVKEEVKLEEEEELLEVLEDEEAREAAFRSVVAGAAPKVSSKAAHDEIGSYKSSILPPFLPISTLKEGKEMFKKAYQMVIDYEKSVVEQSNEKANARRKKMEEEMGISMKKLEILVNAAKDAEKAKKKKSKKSKKSDSDDSEKEESQEETLENVKLSKKEKKIVDKLDLVSLRIPALKKFSKDTFADAIGSFSKLWSRRKKVLNQIARTNEQIEGKAMKKIEKSETATVALSTSKTNYLDPRITISWSKRAAVPITNVFNKSLLMRFPWALDVAPSWTFVKEPEELEEVKTEGLRLRKEAKSGSSGRTKKSSQSRRTSQKEDGSEEEEYGDEKYEEYSESDGPKVERSERRLSIRNLGKDVSYLEESEESDEYNDEESDSSEYEDALSDESE
ncbi:DNA topoisomerase 1 [Aduncisulcus paluster]|uniref:DNA topoisomerase 1 n=1 Tax=Aduncisulcus paluster TaxID=2918883 RepID=A0ABQ5KT74_9EUKA|nr:DNA topoisomerase 1 [Aduncisulcus paluster]